MARTGRPPRRRDAKNRVLRRGESLRADGKYQFKYYVNGKPKFVYSWRLEPTDKLPQGKKPAFPSGNWRSRSDTTSTTSLTPQARI